MKRNYSLWITFFTVIFLAYVIWSQIKIYHLKEQVVRENERSLSIARNIELWKKITLKYDGFFDENRLSNDVNDIEITKLDVGDSAIDSNDNFYILYYKNSANKDHYRKYYSDLTLGNSISIITDKDKKVKDITWSKP